MKRQWFRDIIRGFQKDFDEKIITKAYTFKDFKINKEDQLNYLYTRKDNQFCERYIHPKLTFLLEKFREKVDEKKIETLNL